jgi:N utilization substance protein B
LYAFFQSGGDDLVNGEKQLLKGNDKLYELFIHQLSFLVKLVDYIHNRQEESKKKFLPSEEDLNPNTRFIENKLISQLRENKDYARWYRALKINWIDESNMFLKIYNEIRSTEHFRRYMDLEHAGYKEDKEEIVRITHRHLEEFEPLRQYYEDRSIYWSDEDFDTSIMMVVKTIKAFREDQSDSTPLPTLYQSDHDDDEAGENKKFMLKLFHQTVLHSEEFEHLIAAQVDNWEVERIALMDMIIMKMALAELTSFSAIPVKVSINEYIEISKYYSSAKSRVFINGILDKLIAKLKEEGRIRKSGRGLIE